MTKPSTIAIVGYGLEGQSAYRYLKHQYPNSRVVIYDQNPNLTNLPQDDRVTWELGSSIDFSKIEADLIVRSPGIPLTKFNNRQNLTSATNLFFESFGGKIIGVTGSKGKGTTASLIAALLKAAGLKVRLLGNIGQPALDVLAELDDDTVVVYELSSFQLWDLKQTPDVALLLHIEPDHLNVHTDFNEYLSAKAMIVNATQRRSMNWLIYNAANNHVRSVVDKIDSSWKTVAYPNEKTAYYDDKNIYYGEQKICSISDLHLLGKHNLDNACAALDAAWLFSQNIPAFAQAISAFKGLEHRLQPVDRVGQVNFIDDSIATTIGSVLAAIRAVDGKKVLILGGIDKGADFRQLREAILECQVTSVIAIGETSDKIDRQLAGIDGLEIHNLGLKTTMAEVVELAYRLAQPDGAVILSPACSSFDMFESYQDRGCQFQAAVKKLQARAN